MALAILDVSDNNPIQATFNGLQGVVLKLYPKGSSGAGWLGPQLAHADEWEHEHDFVIGFYAADSTPTWASAKQAAADQTVNLNDHPFAFDLREFGFSESYVRGQISNAHADGQEKVGHYWRLSEDVGEDWRWKAHYLVDPPDEPWLLWQYTSTPLDHSRPHEGVTVHDILDRTTKGAPNMALDPVKDAKTFDSMLADRITNAGWVSGVVEGVKAHEDGEPFDASWGAWKRAGYQAASGGGGTGLHTHTFSGVTSPI